MKVLLLILSWFIVSALGQESSGLFDRLRSTADSLTSLLDTQGQSKTGSLLRAVANAAVSTEDGKEDEEEDNETEEDGGSGPKSALRKAISLHKLRKAAGNLADAASTGELGGVVADAVRATVNGEDCRGRMPDDTYFGCQCVGVIDASRRRKRRSPERVRDFLRCRIGSLFSSDD